MANIVITNKGINGLYVDFGSYASSSLLSPQGFNTQNMSHIFPEGSGVRVVMEGRDSQSWCVSHTAYAGFMIIDTIDGAAPTSQSDLIDKLTSLL